MKAISPVLPMRRTHVSSHTQDLGIWRSKSAWDEPLGVLCDMNDCYSRLKELVPSLPQDRSVTKMEILQHVIDYILDLQIALDSSSDNPQPQPQRRPGVSSSTEEEISSFQINHFAKEMKTDDQITI
ncbi:DNA-binding protein inhibitor ID-2b [Tachysurus ichikawai]